MKYQEIDQQLFVQNRARFIKTLAPGSVALFTSNYEYVLNGDASHTFKQNSNLFWLTGIDQEDTYLMLFPDCPIPEFREALFLKQTNEHIAVWDGYKYTQAHATKVSGIKSVLWNDGFWDKIRPVVNMAETICLALNYNDRFVHKSPYAEFDFAGEVKKRFPLHQYKRCSTDLQRLRSVKSDLELAQVRTAIGISKIGFERILKFTKPGVYEYQIEAELIHAYLSNRATGHSFHPIVASGASACVLHYVENNRVCSDGDLLLVDCGVDYANYASDMTRALPVNGKFTKRQRDVYNAVLRVMREATKLLVPGTLLMEYHQVVGKEFMEKELVDLGLLTMDDIKNEKPEWPAYKKYFMHGTSHFLGIDVHDVGMRYEPMQAGNLFTCEPGIYIKEEGIGIRLENNILITNNGPLDLMDEINMPLEVEEIEALMNS